MIVKTADPVTGQSIRAIAGARAEQDMAFYLRRAFGDHRQDVLVFNDLRFEFEREVAQIDHLVLHRHGMFIIESKSVSGEIHIERSGQFVRIYGRSERVGMPSPVEQAKRQADLLRRMLHHHRTSLRDKVLFGLMQGGFAHCPIEIRVAISDRGIIRGERNAPEVRKADLITHDIEARLRAHVQGSNLLNARDTTDGSYVLSAGELERLRTFLLSQHQPRSADADVDPPGQPTAGHAPQAPLPMHEPAPAQSPQRTKGPPGLPDADPPRRGHMCPRCRSTRLVMLRGAHSYFLRCQSCRGDIRLDLRVPGSGKIGSLRREGRSFILTCPDTGRQFPYFTNPAVTD